MYNKKRRIARRSATLTLNATLVALGGATASDALAQQVAEPAAGSDTQLEQIVVTAFRAITCSLCASECAPKCGKRPCSVATF